MQRFHCRPRVGGFTATELLVTIAISGVLLGLALPSFRSVMADNRMILTGNSVRTGALIARSTAVSLNRRITFCAGHPDSGCHGDWSRQQWLVFDDLDRDGVIDTDESIHLAQQQPPSANVGIYGNGPFNSRIIFTPSGLATTSTGGFAAGRLRLCVDRGSTGNAIDLVLIGSGRLESEQKSLVGGCAAL